MVSLEQSQWDSFEKLYNTDLVYLSDCWKLCGDAHCCSFGRYKARFRLLARTPFQQMPLLPGEYEYMQSKGWLAQFGDFDHSVVEYPLSDYTLKLETIISRRQNCACDHATRPVNCRLYPLLPIFSLEGTCLGVEPMGIYEDLEQIAGMPRACQVESLPFAELEKFLSMACELAKHPIFLYYLEAYRLAKLHVRQRLESVYTADRDIFQLFESMFIRKKLIDHDMLKNQLHSVLVKFRDYYGPDSLPAEPVATVDETVA